MPTTTAAALAAPHRLDHGGKSYSFRLVDGDAKADIQRRLERNARAAATALKGEVPDHVWREAWNATVADIAAQAYRFHGTYASQAPTTFGGMVLVLTVLGSVEDDGRSRPVTEAEMEALALERNEEVQAILTQIMEESFPNLVRAARAKAAAAQAEPATP